MAKFRSIQGRSFVLNALSVGLSIIGFVTVCLSFLPNNVDYFWWVLVPGSLAFLIGTLGVVIFQGRLMFSHVSRILAGSTLIVSGIVKLNDPIGFSFKLEEYFQDGALAYRFKTLFGNPAFTLQGWQEYSVELAITVTIFEVLIGVLLLLGLANRFSSYAFVLLMLFFTFLTWHTASCDVNRQFIDRNQYDVHTKTGQAFIKNDKKDSSFRVVETNQSFVIVDEWRHPQCVTDCGCFGDALKAVMGRSLLPMESLLKDIVLLFFACWIFLAQRFTRPNTRSENTVYLLSTLVLFILAALLFSWVFLGLLAVFILLSSMWVQRISPKGFDNGTGVTIWMVILQVVLIVYVLLFDPIKDFRPFSEGSNLVYKMNDGRPAKNSFVFVLYNKKKGRYEEYNEKQYTNNPNLWDERNYRFVSRKEKIVDPGNPSSLSDQFDPYLEQVFFNIPSGWKIIDDSLKNRQSKQYLFKFIPSGKIDTVSEQRAKNRLSNDNYALIRSIESPSKHASLYLKKAIVKAPRIVLLCAEKLSEANWGKMDLFTELMQWCKDNNIPFLVLTSSSLAEIKEFKKNNGVEVPILQNDSKGLQMISRSSPTLMLLKKGTVKAKFTHRSLPNTKDCKQMITSK
jgi:uncharacterized membrane protein YphA (DoxX/SURF4 family)